jgi:glutamate 5-kinase
MSETSDISFRAKLAASKRIVVKLGSAVLAPGGTLDESTIAQLAADMACACADRELIIVSSGAVASGFRVMGLETMPKSIVQKQAAAAVGQPRLMRAWSDAFAAHGRPVAQVLLTADDLDHRTRLLNARRTLQELLNAGAVPIINENDSVSFDEIKLGDNDRLSALVASLVQADLLLILSGIQGLYAGGDPKKVLHLIPDIAEAMSHVRVGKSDVGTGGMQTKLDAVSIAHAAGSHVVIAGGKSKQIVQRVLASEIVGTLFPAGKATSSRKRWIGHAARVRGAIIIDDGASRALMERGASLLPSGVIAVEGSFESGGTIEVRTRDGTAIARGIAAYSDDEIQRIKGKRSNQIEKTLGYCYAEEIIHRDDLVLTVKRT